MTGKEAIIHYLGTHNSFCAPDVAALTGATVSAAYRAVTMLIPNLTQPTWSRTVKPLYDALVVQCHKEESIADNILNTVTR